MEVVEHAVQRHTMLRIPTNFRWVLNLIPPVYLVNIVRAAICSVSSLGTLDTDRIT